MKSQLQTIGGKVKMIPIAIAAIVVWFFLDAFLPQSYNCSNCGVELIGGNVMGARGDTCPACGEVARD